MFNKKDVIFSETIGVCEVRDITKLTEDNGRSFDYYVLRSVYDKTKVAYIPVEGHKVVLRNIMSAEEAQNAFEELKTRQDKDKKEQADMLRIGEIAYVLHKKPDEMPPADEGSDNNGQ